MRLSLSRLPQFVRARGRKTVDFAWAYRFLIVLTLLAVTPVVYACARAAVDGWWPQGDDAIVALKVRDVFSSNPPTMGMRSTSGDWVKTPQLVSHHLGPLQLYLLAIPAFLAGYQPIGLIIGTALITIVAIVGIVVVAYRRGGASLAALAIGAILLVEWAVGPEALYRTLNPFAGILPILLLLLLAWSLLVGDLACMWAFVVTASLVAQVDLAFAPLAIVLTLMVAVVGLVRWWRIRETIWPVPGWRQVGGPNQPRHGWYAVAAFFLCWLPVLVETVTYHPNNVSQLIRFFVSNSTAATNGWEFALRFGLPKLVPVPGGFSSATPAAAGGHSFAAAIAGGAVVLLLSVLASRRLTKRWSPWWGQSQRLACLVATVSLLVVFWAFSSAPAGKLEVYWMVQLWPVVAFSWMVLAWALWRIVRLRSSHVAWHTEGASWRIPLTVLAAAAAVAAIMSPAHSNENDKAVRRVSAVIEKYLDGVTDKNAPVQVQSGGGLKTWLTTAPAVAYRLTAAGHYPVFQSGFWYYPDDSDFRFVESAPHGTTSIYLRERGTTSWFGEAPIDSKLIFTLPAPSPDRVGELQVYVSPASAAR